MIFDWIFKKKEPRDFDIQYEYLKDKLANPIPTRHDAKVITSEVSYLVTLATIRGDVKKIEIIEALMRLRMTEKGFL